MLPINKYNDKTIPTFYRFMIRLPNYNIKRVINEIKQRNIFCGKGVIQLLYRLLRLDIKRYPISEKLAKEMVSLPIPPFLSIKDIKYISENFMEALEKLRCW